jgi:hypothetical protein
MFPCFDQSVTYGLAVTGLNVSGATFPLSLSTPGSVSEPDVRMGQSPSSLTGTVTVTGLTVGASYILYRYNSTAALPMGPNFDIGYDTKTPFTAAAPSWTFDDTKPFASNTAVYYVAVAA